MFIILNWIEGFTIALQIEENEKKHVLYWKILYPVWAVYSLLRENGKKASKLLEQNEKFHSSGELLKNTKEKSSMGH